MSQLVIPNGFELVTFPWDQLPAFVRGANRGAGTPPPAYAALRLSVTPPRIDCLPFDEEPERWDGLS